MSVCVILAVVADNNDAKIYHLSDPHLKLVLWFILVRSNFGCFPKQSLFFPVLRCYQWL